MKNKFLVFFLYYLFFLAIFLQYPLSDSLPGNTDNIAHLAFFKDYANRAISLFTGQEIGNAYYPEASVQIYAEPYLVQSIIFLFYKLFFLNDLWAFYFFESTVYALNGFSLFLLVSYLLSKTNTVQTPHSPLKKYLPAVYSGFIFSASGFAFSNIELMNGIAYFPFFLAAYFFMHFLEKGDRKSLLLTYILAGIQVYASGYIFVYMNLLFLLILLFQFKQIFLNKRLLVPLLAYSPLYLLFIIPYILYFIFDSAISTAYNPLTANPSLIGNFSLRLSDFCRPLDGNLIYPDVKDEQKGIVIRNLYRAHIGIPVYCFMLMGLFRRFKYKWIFISLILIGLFIAFGPYIHFWGNKIAMPMKWLIEHTFLAHFFRIPGRAFGMVLFGIAVFSGLGMSYFLNQLKWAVPIAMAVVIFFFFENIPAKFDTYNSQLWLNPSNVYLSYLKEQDRQDVIMELPSSLFSEHSAYRNGISEFSREYIYFYWQTKHKLNTINGSSAYWPESRLYNNDLMINIIENQNLGEAIRLNSLDHVIFHKDLIVKDQEDNILSLLDESPLLKKINSDERVNIYAVLK